MPWVFQELPLKPGQRGSTMAKNFASVLESLRVAGGDKLQEVDSIYTLNCDWLLQHFKHTQASLAALGPSVQAAVNVQKEQQVHVHDLWGQCWLCALQAGYHQTFCWYRALQKCPGN